MRSSHTHSSGPSDIPVALSASHLQIFLTLIFYHWVQTFQDFVQELGWEINFCTGCSCNSVFVSLKCCEFSEVYQICLLLLTWYTYTVTMGNVAKDQFISLTVKNKKFKIFEKNTMVILTHSTSDISFQRTLIKIVYIQVISHSKVFFFEATSTLSLVRLYVCTSIPPLLCMTNLKFDSWKVLTWRRISRS